MHELRIGPLRPAPRRPEKSSSGNTLTATGMETPLTVKIRLATCFSQYRRAAESAVFVSQESVMLSSMSSRERPSA